MSTSGLVIALCTRNRPTELLRACRTIAADAAGHELALGTVLVVDAGPLDSASLEAVREALAPTAAAVEHIDVSGRARSLYDSRLVALRRARELGACHVAFFDDDVELVPRYLPRLAQWLENEAPAMVGGVDLHAPVPHALRRGWMRFTGVSSGDPARLSGSGFNRSIWLWLSRGDPFRSEFASGCNMTVDVRVLDELSPAAGDVFASYSLGEDLYLSACARRIGEIVVDPAMRVRHHASPAARDARAEVYRQLLVNHAWLVREDGRSRLLFGWTMLWLALRGLLEDVRLAQPRGAALGLLRGTPAAVRLLFARR